MVKASLARVGIEFGSEDSSTLYFATKSVPSPLRTASAREDTGAGESQSLTRPMGPLQVKAASISKLIFCGLVTRQAMVDHPPRRFTASVTLVSMASRRNARASRKLLFPAAFLPTNMVNG